MDEDHTGVNSAVDAQNILLGNQLRVTWRDVRKTEPPFFRDAISNQTVRFSLVTLH